MNKNGKNNKRPNLRIIGDFNVLGGRMEKFFKNDELFWYATPNFFTEQEVQE